MPTLTPSSTRKTVSHCIRVSSGAFKIFWEAGVLRFWRNQSRITRPPRSRFSGAHLLWVQYMILIVFLYDAWLKRRTYYGITNRPGPSQEA